jgi:hypothetical protein
MKKILNIFFTSLGFIFFILILFGIYFYVADPLNLKPLFMNSESDSVETAEVNNESVDRNPALNSDQEAALEKFGIDPANVPSQITAEQEDCFVEKIGEQRVQEIKAGDTPTSIEFFKAKDCI